MSALCFSAPLPRGLQFLPSPFAIWPEGRWPGSAENLDAMDRALFDSIEFDDLKELIVEGAAAWFVKRWMEKSRLPRSIKKVTWISPWMDAAPLTGRLIERLRQLYQKDAEVARSNELRTALFKRTTWEDLHAQSILDQLVSEDFLWPLLFKRSRSLRLAIQTWSRHSAQPDLRWLRRWLEIALTEESDRPADVSPWLFRANYFETTHRVLIGTNDPLLRLIGHGALNERFQASEMKFLDDASFFVRFDQPILTLEEIRLPLSEPFLPGVRRAPVQTASKKTAGDAVQGAE